MSKETRGAPTGNSNASQFEGQTQSARIDFRCLPYYRGRFERQAEREGKDLKQWMIETCDAKVEE